MCKVSTASNNSITLPVFTIAIYCGKQKPPLETFFEKFVEELFNLCSEGLKIEKNMYEVKVGAFCFDTPACPFVKNVKGHNGYYGSDKCNCEGVYKNHKMLYTDLRASQRTDMSFLLKEDPNHHRGFTPLQNLGIGMVTQFPIDYMHSICLGVMRKLLFCWRDGSRLYRITKNNLLKLNEHISLTGKFWPAEFNRKPRGLNELERWKATELRQFLLYVGPVAMKNILPMHVYSNFMILTYLILYYNSFE